jgi:CRP/FNR family transcriptional regulator, cyclic AMP receptor protein
MARVETEAAERFLNAPMLADFDADARRAMLAALVEQRAGAGQVLLVQGEPNDHLSFLIEGSVVVERRLPGGRVEAIATLNAPSVFGTTSFFCTKPPSFGVRAAGDVWLLTLHHPEHERLRRDDPHAAEALALAAMRIVSERFDELDRLFSGYIAAHPDDHPKVNEWAGFRARLFEEPGA